MTREDIKAALIEVLEDILDRDDIDLQDSTSAEQVEGWDSLSHIRIMAASERRFKVRFTNAEIDSLETAGQLIDLIQAKLSK